MEPNASTAEQKIDQGAGPVYHRVYAVTFEATPERAREMMCRLQTDINDFSPQLIAKFEKLHGSADRMAKGDVYHVHISGPWDGPVRVIEVKEQTFGLCTLEGHMEAGHIHFTLRPIGANQFRFEIESRARSRNRLVDFVYDKLPIAKLAQTEMWKEFCETFAKETQPDADKRSPIEIITERQDEETGRWRQI